MKQRIPLCALVTTFIVAATILVVRSKQGDVGVSHVHVKEPVSRREGSLSATSEPREPVALAPTTESHGQRTQVDIDEKKGPVDNATTLPKEVKRMVLRALTSNLSQSEKQYVSLLASWKGGKELGLDAQSKEAELSYDIETSRSALSALRAGDYLVSRSNDTSEDAFDRDYTTKKYLGLFFMEGQSHDLTIRWKPSEASREWADSKRMRDLWLRAAEEWCRIFNAKPLHERKALYENQLALREKVRECSKRANPSLEESKACRRLADQLFPSRVRMDVTTLRARASHR